VNTLYGGFKSILILDLINLIYFLVNGKTMGYQ